MKGFILRLAFLFAFIIGFYLAGIYIAAYLSNPVTVYVFATIYSLLVLGVAFFLTAASFNEPMRK